MVITLMCDNPNSWIIPYIHDLEIKIKEMKHHVEVINNCSQIKYGDLLFLLACEKILPTSYMKMNKHNLVVHESELPRGKGWSPVTWQVLEGKNRIPVTLFEADNKIDSGNIYLQNFINLDGSELNGEIKHKQWLCTIELILEFIKKYPDIKSRVQYGEESFYPKRDSKDSELNINQTIKEQFDLLRVVDNERYPAYFIIGNRKYVIKIYKENNNE